MAADDGLDRIASLLEVLGLPGTAAGAQLARVLVAEHRRRISVALEAAEHRSGLAREELAEWMANHPPSLQLVTRVLLAAGNSGNDETLNMLGAQLGSAAAAGGATDGQEVLITAIEGLNPPQLLVIRATTDEFSRTAHEVARTLRGRLAQDLVEPTLYSLVSRGFFKKPFGGFGGTEIWWLSALGQAVKDAAREVQPKA